MQTLARYLLVLVGVSLTSCVLDSEPESGYSADEDGGVDVGVISSAFLICDAQRLAVDRAASDNHTIYSNCSKVLRSNPPYWACSVSYPDPSIRVRVFNIHSTPDGSYGSAEAEVYKVLGTNSTQITEHIQCDCRAGCQATRY